ncbi:MAG: hypothetical protein IT314_04655 [Anaerolineales bacterium]|nr:hypothetical protein [Anaerolineales bacterium]
MNVGEYFESVKDRILTDSFVVDFKILKYVNRSNNGYLRARIVFSDNSQLEFSEFIEQNTEGTIQLVTYSYHWADENNTLIRRWDNAPHFPKLKNAPHHIHYGKGGRVKSGNQTNVFEVIKEISSTINK